MKFRTLFCATAIAAVASFSATAFADGDTAPKELFSKAEQSEIHKIMVQYLYDNPQVLTMMVQRLGQVGAGNNGTAPTAAAPAPNNPSIAANIDRDKLENGPSVGEVDAPVTVVEFFDYNCGYCKRAGEFIEAIHKNYSPAQVRVVFREFPILGEGSRIAARYALAAHFGAPEMYINVHNTLMRSHNPMRSEDDVIAVLKAGDIDVAKLQSLMAQSEVRSSIEAEIAQNASLGQQAGVTGTPAFVIGDDAVKGAQIGVLKSLIDQNLAKAGS
ncbi:MAG: DsbA family protein [Porticoccaceae bacterium]